MTPGGVNGVNLSGVGCVHMYVGGPNKYNIIIHT